MGVISVLWRDNIITVEGYLQYCGGITAVHVGDGFSTVGDTFSTVEVLQYSGGKHQYCRGYSIQSGKNFNFGMFGH